MPAPSRREAAAALDEQALRGIAPPAVRMRQHRRPAAPAARCDGASRRCRAASCRARRDRSGRSRSAAPACARGSDRAGTRSCDRRCSMIPRYMSTTYKRAVGRIGEIDRPEALVGRRQELAPLVRLPRLQRRAVVARARSGSPGSPPAPRRTRCRRDPPAAGRRDRRAARRPP